MLKLNIGSFTVMTKGWTNIDILDLNQYAVQNGFDFKQLDATKGLPYQDNTVDLIIASHFIEHITREEGLNFLRHSFRVLKPDRVIRLTIPDAEIITKDYLSGNIARHASHNEGVKNAEDDAESLLHLLIAGHKTIYDYKSLSKLLQKTGFVDIKKQEYQKSYSKEIENETRDMFPELSLYLEAKKPGTIQQIEQIEQPKSLVKIPVITLPQSQEKQYKFSIVYPTYRPGSMDLLFESLSRQTYKNFELILVDDYLIRTNNKQELYNQLPNKQIPKYLKYHDPPKPDCFNKFYKFGTTVNTGIIEAIKSDFNADIIIFLQDYTYLLPGQLEKWNKAFNETGLDTIITGAATIFSTPNPTKWKDIYSIWDNGINVIEHLRYHSQWTPEEYEGFYTGIPKDILVKLNGLDENIDYPPEQANDFFERAKASGYKLKVDPELNCYMMDHRSWHPPDEKDDYLWHIYRFESLRKGAAPPVIPLEEYVRQLKEGKRNIKANNCFDLEVLNKAPKPIYIESIEPIKSVIVNNAYEARIKFQLSNVAKCIANTDNKAILNIGCGDCYPFIDSNLDILHIDTVDQVPESVKPKVKFKLMDAHNLPFKNKEFVCSLLGDTLEHVKDPVQVLKEAKRVGRNVYITVPNEFGWSKVLNPFTNPGHVRHYNYDTLTKDLDEGLGKDSYIIEQYDGGGWSFWCISYEEEQKLITLNDKKLRIALISTPFFTVPPQGYSGLEQIVWDLAEGLDELGYEVTIFANKGSKSTKHGFLIETGESINTVNVNWFEEEKKRYEVYKNIITPEKFDIVHGHTWFGFEYLLKRKYPNLKVCHTHHGSFVWESPPSW